MGLGLMCAAADVVQKLSKVDSMGLLNTQESQRQDARRIPRLRFDTSSFSADERLDALNTFSRGLYCYSINQLDGSAPRLDLDAWALDDIAAASISYGPTEVQEPNRIAADFEEMVFLRWVKSGRIRIISGDTQREFKQGSLFLMHGRHKLVSLDDGSAYSLRLPFSRVGYDPLKHEPILELRNDIWQVRVLSSAIEALFETLPDMPLSNIQAVAGQLAALVEAANAIDPREEEHLSALNSNRKMAMRRFLLANLSRTDLSVGYLQSEFGASRATIYRAFEDVGGVARFVREQRLASIHRELRMTPPARGAIRQSAERYGLWDQASFMRMFRAQYGVRPGDVLGSAVEGELLDPRIAHETKIDLPSLASFWAS